MKAHWINRRGKVMKFHRIGKMILASLIFVCVAASAGPARAANNVGDLALSAFQLQHHPADVFANVGASDIGYHLVPMA